MVLTNRIETFEAIVEMYERNGLEPDPGIVSELAMLKEEVKANES